jgi:hypothetical protein
MSFMLRSMILLCVGVILCPPRSAIAQALGESELDHISQRLELTDSQKENIRPLVMNEEKEVARVRNDSSLTAKEKGQKEIDIRATYEQQMKNRGLSPTQMRKLKELRQEETEQIRKRMYAGEHPPTQ